MVDGSGGPLSAVVAGANVHDTKLLAMTLERIVMERPDTGIQHQCLDKGYDNPTGHRAVATHGYRGHIRRIGEEKLDSDRVKRFPARRWVAERNPGLAIQVPCGPGALHNLVRYDKKVSNYMGLLQLACALLWYRRQRQSKL